MPASGPISDPYSPMVGLVYIFNLIVGTGALTMPKAFAEAGWLLSLIVVFILAFMSYLTATFMVEAMSAANALLRYKTLQQYTRTSNEADTIHEPGTSGHDLVNQTEDDMDESSVVRDETVDVKQDIELMKNDDLAAPPSYSSIDGVITEKGYRYRKHSDAVESVPDTANVDYFAITDAFEMGRMATMFYHKIGTQLFYLCIAIYLYGDLAIYAAAVAKSLRDVACEKLPGKPTWDDICWPSKNINRLEAYRIFVVTFVAVVGPFTFFNVQKTKYLQIATTILRWKAFISMIVLCLIAMIGGKGDGHPPAGDVKQLPNLFGVCVYSFMCHHSLPSLITPIQPKKKIYSLIAGDFILILSFYLLLCFTGIFTFRDLEDMYTLNFKPSKGGTVVPSVPYLQYFLSLFPVLTLSSNFPIIAITLRNNLKTLLLNDNSPWALNQVMLPLLALIPPFLVALATENVEILVSVTGSYAGAIIQYVVPASLVFFARKEVIEVLGHGIKNNYASPFRQAFWIPFVMIWTAFCVIFVTVRHFI